MKRIFIYTGSNTGEGYYGLNRVTYIEEADRNDRVYSWTSLDGNSIYYFENFSPYASNFLIINKYDTLGNSAPSPFTPPSDYYSIANYTKDNLCATAYRTRGTDPWNYKYYRYDVRGRIIRMWHVIDGLDTKTIDYTYNSQNQVKCKTVLKKSLRSSGTSMIKLEGLRMLVCLDLIPLKIIITSPLMNITKIHRYRIEAQL